MSRPSLPPDYFDDLYAHSDDPWRISVGFYESRKRALTLACFPEPKVAVAVEIGCGNGDLSEPLADRCDRLIAVDVAAQAVATTRTRLRNHPHVEVRQARVPEQTPTDPFDLAILSEVGYYLDADDLSATLDRLVAVARPAATIVAVHWRHEAEGYPLSGDDVHALIADRPELNQLATYVDDDLRLDVHTVGARPSVARAHGVL